MRKFESTERFNNLREVLEHLVSGGVVTNMDDSCPGCGVFLDDDGQLKFIETIVDFPLADCSFNNNSATGFRPLIPKQIAQYLRTKTK